jgi:hypothetical protein
MYDIPIKYAGLTFCTIASGAASMINEKTLIPLGVFIVCTFFLVAAAWKVATAVTKATGRLENVEKRVKQIESKLEEEGKL